MDVLQSTKVRRLDDLWDVIVECLLDVFSNTIVDFYAFVDTFYIVFDMLDYQCWIYEMGVAISSKLINKLKFGLEWSDRGRHSPDLEKQELLP